MIITISGKAGSGKSTIAKSVAEKLGLKHYSSGDFMRAIAKERKISLAELSSEAESDGGVIDREIDKRQKELGKTEKNFIIDGRLSAFFIQNADFKIFLDVTLAESARRILGDNRTEEGATDIPGMKKKIKEREASEIKRYKEYYGFDCYDKKNYDSVIDTSKLSVAEVIDQVLNIINNKQ